MSQSKNNVQQKRNETRSLPSEVLLRARSTFFSLGGALKSKQENQSKCRKSKEKKSNDRLKNSRSEPEFGDVRKDKHRSLIDSGRRDFWSPVVRRRPLSVGAAKRYERDSDDLSYNNVSYHPRVYDSNEDECSQSRFVIPAADRLSTQDLQDERPRKKLSFRDPEIVSGSSTLGRTSKLMGINSLAKRPQKMKPEPLYSSLEVLDSDLESQAMKIVRTVGQAFEVCHKMHLNSPDPPEASTSSTVDEPLASERNSERPASKEAASECGGSEPPPGSLKQETVPEPPCRAKQIELLPPPPRKENRRSPQRSTTAPNICLPELPECVTKPDVNSDVSDDSTPLSSQHQLQLLRERLDQQTQQTRAAVAQLLLLRNQLAAEQAARCEAQARTHQLLVHNKELLEHIAALVAHLQERERGSSTPINAQQLTLLPQRCPTPSRNESTEKNSKKENATKDRPICNGNHQLDTDAVLDLITQSAKLTQNLENNNLRLSPFTMTPIIPGTPNGSPTVPTFSGMTNEQIQAYLISKFQGMDTLTNGNAEKKDANQHYFQNSNAFPNIPPLTNHYSSSDLASLTNHKAYKECNMEELSTIAHGMNVGQSDNSLYSTSQATSSKDSIPDEFEADDGAAFIMPLSHNATLAAKGDDGRVRLIVPVSPSTSSSNIPEFQLTEPNGSTGITLKVPTVGRSLAAAAPITRSTSEKVPNRSEMMSALRAQWTRHTTK